MSTSLQYTKEDDFVECFLFPTFCYESTEPEVTRELLTSEINKFNNELKKYTDDYMWHRDSLVFQPRSKNEMLLDKELRGVTELEDHNLPPHVYAGLRFDEDVGDEWFLVFLVMELTKAFDGLIVKLVDSDGEFLLIETANVLPNWASPQTCQDRVFVYGGEIHIVRGQNEGYLKMLRSIRNNPEISRLSDAVQAVIKNKISLYPEEIKKRMHKARAFLPERAIAVLKQEPRLIAAALRSVCRSDPLERKVCQAMRYFPPEQRAMVNVNMTRCLYAMATHSRYTGDPRTGWNLVPPSDSRHSAHSLGIKIACGLEMLVSQASAKNKRQEGNDAVTNANENEWAAYTRRLTSNGYFKDLLEGSQEYMKLLQSAKEFFYSNSTNSSSIDFESEAHRVLDAVRNVQRCDIESLDEGRLSPADSDGWLNIDPEQLQSMLDEQWSSNDTMLDRQLPTLQEKVKDFLLQSSDVDGVQLPGQQTAMDEDTNESRGNADVDDSRIEFNTEAFDSALRGILDLVVPGDENDFDSGSESSIGGSEDDQGGELDKYMRILDSQLEMDLHMSAVRGTAGKGSDAEANLRESAESEAGGAGPVGNILGGPVRRLMHLHLQSPSSVPPDLQKVFSSTSDQT